MAQLDRVSHVAPRAEVAAELLEARDVAFEVARQLPHDRSELVAERLRLVAQPRDRLRAVLQAFVVRDEAMTLEREAELIGRLGVPARVRLWANLRVERAVDLERVEHARRNVQPLLHRRIGVEMLAPALVDPAAGSDVRTRHARIPCISQAEPRAAEHGTTRATSSRMARSTVAAKLAKYKAKRDFGITAEPSGSKKAAKHAGNSFVIQQHAARRLHYDFRLELDGVLLSWSVPKGPSLSPTEKRLAVRTEDHPLDYADFEGIIPKGQYGGGTVCVWDRGTWEPEGDPREAMRKGRLTFTLHGAKLHGRWHLIRTRGDDKHDNWLLFKSRDEAANENLDIVATKPKSVITGRTLAQIEKDADRVWHSNRAANDQPDAQPHAKSARKTIFRNVDLANAAHKKLPKQERTAASAAAPSNVTALVKQLPLGFELSNLDKILYPEQGLTKGQLIAYLAVVADWMLPHVDNRPLTLVRCPEGRAKPCFFQKKIYPGAPKAIGTVKIREEDGTVVDYMKVRDMPGLVGLAQLGTLETHIWGCHADKVERPDFMVFDLDPDEGLPWERVALAAFDVRRRLGDLGLESFLKTTGGKGLHVCIPLERRMDWDDFKAWSKAFADQLATQEPKLYTSNMAKSARRGKIFVDYLRNGRNATFIAPYSPRARAGAPVSVPLSWEELAHGVEPASFTIETVPARLAKLDDPWRDIYEVKQAITAAMWKAVGGKP
jgi:bifunctional non-homologous end joining protein LigD